MWQHWLSSYWTSGIDVHSSRVDSFSNRTSLNQSKRCLTSSCEILYSDVLVNDANMIGGCTLCCQRLICFQIAWFGYVQVATLFLGDVADKQLDDFTDRAQVPVCSTDYWYTESIETFSRVLTRSAEAPLLSDVPMWAESGVIIWIVCSWQ